MDFSISVQACIGWAASGLHIEGRWSGFRRTPSLLRQHGLMTLDNTKDKTMILTGLGNRNLCAAYLMHALVTGDPAREGRLVG
jgi:hypothetical protein